MKPAALIVALVLLAAIVSRHAIGDGARSAAHTEPHRPQVPQKPYPYHEEEVRFANAGAGIHLAGTLTIPSSAGRHPAVVLASGSGPQDRDQSVAGHRPFLVLADHLTRQGIAVLRCDDRGVGKSGGDFAKATNPDFVDDVLAAVAYLRTRPEIDAARIGVAGHSEGAITVPRAAAKSRDVAFLVLLAGAGVPMDQLLVRQAADLLRAAGTDEATIEQQCELQRELFRAVRDEGADQAGEAKVRTILRRIIDGCTREQSVALDITEEYLEPLSKTYASEWFRELLSYNPATTLAAVKCPVLALSGAKDLQIAPGDNLIGIETALKKGGNADVTVMVLPGLNHLFQSAATGAIAEYSAIEETISPVALATISDWIRSRAAIR